MAKHGQHQQDTSASKRSGGGQTIVELCDVIAGGLIFWSRQRFEIGAELQIRTLRSALPAHCIPAGCTDEWVTVRGFVVECPPVRRSDGAPGFRVSLLLDSALMESSRRQSPATLPLMNTRFSGLRAVGLN